ncbi:MAG: rhomboid family intramembrane serine protease [Bacteroidetes bacterium]|nr:rhomboid family intramembrane serine protease [Bacteroidota bacterium]
MPAVIKNLLIVNILLFLASIGLGSAANIDLTRYLGLYYFRSELFYPYQLISHMFMHADFSHVFFNMFALWMFGAVLENHWGGKRFLIYYLICGLGAAGLQLGVAYIEVLRTTAAMDNESIEYAVSYGADAIMQGKNFVHPQMAKLNALYHVPMIGASGAVFGVLLAFGMTFPNSLVYIFFAIPMKAKYLVIIYGLAELYFGVMNLPGDNVAHFAHLGGMIFGFFLIRYWKKKDKSRWR